MMRYTINVIDLNGNAIKGLYTCGNSLGGRYGTGYNTPCAGNSIGMTGTPAASPGSMCTRRAELSRKKIKTRPPIFSS